MCSKTVNICENRKDFINEYMAVRKNAYFTAIMQAFKLTSGKRWSHINFTYDNNGLIYLSIQKDDDETEVLYKKP